MSDTDLSTSGNTVTGANRAYASIPGFEDGPPPHRSLPKRIRGAMRRKLGVTIIVIAALIAGGIYLGYRARGTGNNFIDAAARIGTVRQVITLAGTIEPTVQSNLYFSASGTVSAIDVSAGQNVKAGQLLATLDDTSTANQVTQAQSTLSTAQANLASAEASLPIGNSVNNTALTQSQLSVSQDQAQVTQDQALLAEAQSIAANFCQGGPSSTECETAQQNLTSAQATVANDNQTIAQDQINLTATQNKNQQSSDQASASLTNAENQLNSAQAALSVCQAVTTNNCSTQQAAVTSANSSVSEAQVSLTDVTNQNQTSLAQSQLALSQAQSKLATDQATLQLDSSIATGGCSAQTSSPECVSAQAAETQQSQTLVAAQNSLANAQAQLTSTQDKNSQTNFQSQSQVNLDKLQVTADQQALAADQALASQYQITAPSPGTIEAVDLTAGSPSSGGYLVFKSSNSWLVDASVSDTQISSISVGQQALITPSSSSTALFGTVTSIADTATVTSGVASFPVTVSVSQTQLGANGQVINASGLFAGASASVQVITKSVANVLTVPTSAIHTVGTRSFVFTQTGKTEKRVPVTLGATGVPLTQIDSGLTLGERVVIANLSAASPTVAAARGAFAGRAFGGGGGGFGGGGLGRGAGGGLGG